MALHRQNLNDDSRYIEMTSKREGACKECESLIEEGDTIVWDTKEYKAYCKHCGEEYL